MAHGVTTHMYLASLPERPRGLDGRASALWRQLRADERLKQVEEQLRGKAA